MRGNRYWMWVGARLAVGVAIIAWAASYLTPGGGEKELQKALDAMKQVRSFRVASTATPATQHDETLWEVDCNRNAVHYLNHFTDSQITPPVQNDRDEMNVGGRIYWRASRDGAWSSSPNGGISKPASWYCKNLADGIDTNPFPQLATMIKRGIIEKGDKKTVNGVRCREWLVAFRGAPSGLEHDTVCLGVDDHLPYEWTVDWMHSRSSFSDYNTAIALDLPEATVQPASATGAN